MGSGWAGLGKRPAVFPSLACGLGVVVGPSLASSVSAWLLVALVALAVAWWRGQQVGGTLALLAASFALGGGLAELGVDVETPPLSSRVRVTGTVETVGAFGFVFAVDAVEGSSTRFRAAMSSDGAHVETGQRLAFEARFKPNGEAANPGEWSRATWAWRRGQPVTGVVQKDRIVVLAQAPGWRRWLDREHASLIRDVQTVGDKDATAFLLTLAAGQRAQLDDELEDAFARSGLAHVLSVSGLHVAALALTLFGVLRWLLSRRMTSRTRLIDPRAFAAPLSIPLVWAYVLFTGWQAPAVRSAVMCTVLLAAWVVRRRSDALNALALAALVMLAVDPAAPFDLSVQLSFLAVLALVLFAPIVREALPFEAPSHRTHEGWSYRWRAWRESALQTFSASAAVTLTTAPLVLAAFQRVSLAGLISNVVTLPLSGVLTLVSAGGAAVHLVSPTCALPVLWVGVQLSRLFVHIANGFAALPYAAAELPSPPAPIVTAWFIGLAFLVLAHGRLRWLAMLSPLALVVHLSMPPVVSGDTRVTFLSVGHGDAIVVSSRGHHALIDGGGVPQGHDTGKRFVLPYLRHQGIAQLDLAVLSHAHPDHALGLISTLSEVTTERLWLPFEVEGGSLVDDLLVAAGDARVERKRVGEPGMTLGALQIEVLGPPVDQSQLEGENDRSIVLRLTHGEVTFLLTGDIETAGELPIDPGTVTVMKAPHHGSDTSSTPAFVERTRPKHVVFCVGRRNRFDFPREEIVRRWAEVGAECHRTDLDGAITFISDGHEVKVETFAPVLERRARIRAR